MPRPPSLSPDLMATFVTVIRMEGDATRAAEILGINQPSMSKRLAFLQHAGRILRKPWLERIGKNWQLTPEGRRVLPAVEELVHRYRLLTESLDEARPEIIFGCGPAGAAGFVRDALKRFRAEHPDTGFRICSQPARMRVEGVANGSLDLACVRLEPHDIHELAHRSLHIEELTSDPLVLAAAKGVDGFDEFQELNEKGMLPKAILRFPLILPEAECGLRRDFDRRCRDAGVLDRLKIVVEAGPPATAMAYVRDGVGVGVVPRSAAESFADVHVKALPPKLSPSTTKRVICRRKSGSDDLDLSPAAAAFLEALRG